jgi:hypothetical protein
MPTEITGQLLFDALEVGREWASLSDDRQSHYNNIAARLHAQYLASRQEAGPITGQIIHEIYMKHATVQAFPWEELQKRSREVYNALAQELNAQYLAPLQGLVRDWRELVQANEELNVMSLAEIEGWNKDWEELKKRTQEILQGAQPYHSTIHQCQVSEQQIAQLQRENDALKAVLTSYRVLVSHDAPVMKRNREEWDRERDELIRMATMLLKDEQKEG